MSLHLNEMPDQSPATFNFPHQSNPFYHKLFNQSDHVNYNESPNQSHELSHDSSQSKCSLQRDLDAKSSSIDTLDSLDSGLDSSPSNLTGSHDSIESMSSHAPQIRQSCNDSDPCHAEFSPFPVLETQFSPLGSPSLETEDETSPTLIGFRRTSSPLEVRCFGIGLCWFSV